jgi:hypothetical protein
MFDMVSSSIQNKTFEIDLKKLDTDNFSLWKFKMHSMFPKHSCMKVKLVVEKKVPLKKKVKAKYPKPFPFAHLVI